MEKIRVLMIDDNKNLVEMVKEYFTGHKKIEVTLTCKDGEEGLNTILNKNYKTLSRGILYREDAIFNQDLSPYAILLEVGGVDNTIEEVNNSLEAFSLVLKEYLDNEELNG